MGARRCWSLQTKLPSMGDPGGSSCSTTFNTVESGRGFCFDCYKNHGSFIQISKQPGLFTCSVENNLKPTVAYLKSIGLRVEQIAKQPKLFTLSVENNLKPTVAYLKSIGLRDEQIAHAQSPDICRGTTMGTIPYERWRWRGGRRWRYYYWQRLKDDPYIIFPTPGGKSFCVQMKFFYGSKLHACSLWTS